MSARDTKVNKTPSKLQGVHILESMQETNYIKMVNITIEMCIRLMTVS